MTTILIILALYITCAVLSFGMVVASWWVFYKEYDYHYPDPFITYESSVCLYTMFGPIGLLTSIMNHKKGDPWFKWNFKDL